MHCLGIRMALSVKVGAFCMLLSLEHDRGLGFGPSPRKFVFPNRQAKKMQKIRKSMKQKKQKTKQKNEM